MGYARIYPVYSHQSSAGDPREIAPRLLLTSLRNVSHRWSYSFSLPPNLMREFRRPMEVGTMMELSSKSRDFQLSWGWSICLTPIRLAHSHWCSLACSSRTAVPQTELTLSLPSHVNIPVSAPVHSLKSHAFPPDLERLRSKRITTLPFDILISGATASPLSSS